MKRKDMKKITLTKSLFAVVLMIVAASAAVNAQKCKRQAITLTNAGHTGSVSGKIGSCNLYLIKIKNDQRIQMELVSSSENTLFSLIQANANEEERGGDWPWEDVKKMNWYANEDVEFEVSVYDISEDEPQKADFTLTVKIHDSKIVNVGVINGKAVSLPSPMVPEEARIANAKGAVHVSVEVGEDGEVYFAEAVSGNELLRGAAEEAARRARFKPLSLNNTNVRQKGVVVYNFK